jgi:hypothetical protein
VLRLNERPETYPEAIGVRPRGLTDLAAHHVRHGEHRHLDWASGGKPQQ